MLREEAPDLNPVALIDRVVDTLDLYALVAAMPDGEQRVQRLMDLSAMAETFRNTGEYGLHRFVCLPHDPGMNWLPALRGERQ